MNKSVAKFDIDNCTVQEACDYAIKKIVEQGYACTHDDGDCAYGDDKGGHCAIGWLLPEDDYMLMGFMGSIDQLVRDMSDECDIPKIITENQRVFTLVQRVHDVSNTTYTTKIGGRLDEYFRELKKLGISTEGQHWQDWRTIVCPEKF